MEGLEMDKKESSMLKDFAKKVRVRRHELGFTQEEVAERADFHVNYIGEMERAERNPSFASVVALARALQLSPKDLMPD